MALSTNNKIRIGPKHIAQVARLLSSKQGDIALTDDTLGRVVTALITSDPTTTRDDVPGLLSLVSPGARSTVEALLGFQVKLTSPEIMSRLDFLDGWFYLEKTPAALLEEKSSRLTERIPEISLVDLKFLQHCDTEEFTAIKEFFTDLAPAYRGINRTVKSDRIYDMITKVRDKVKSRYGGLDESALEGSVMLACKACGLRS